MCAAQSEAECGCSGVDWTPVLVYFLREDVNRLERENAMLLKDKERYEWLKDGKGSHWAYNYLRDNFRINDDAIDAARKEGGAT
jgi:hypothetical protein